MTERLDENECCRKLLLKFRFLGSLPLMVLGGSATDQFTICLLACFESVFCNAFFFGRRCERHIHVMG